MVFVEVKSRRSGRFGGGAEAVDGRKQAKLMAIAQFYIAFQPDRPCRFDVVTVTFAAGRAHLEHLINAFP
ncbi:hypothetical protein D3C72_2366190 [compost metagenome]